MEPDHPATLSLARRRFRHVFVLCTGRCGSVTFAKACGHFSNYSAGHETNRATGPARLAYPEGHIEVDNRLAWFLGGLEERYGDDALYLHLVRDESQVAASYDRRWHHHGSLIRGFSEGVCGHTLPGPEAAADLAAAVNANIRAFLRDKPHVLTGDIDDVTSWFPRFAAAIGAEGNLQAALAEFEQPPQCVGPEPRRAGRRRPGTAVAGVAADHAAHKTSRGGATAAGWPVSGPRSESPGEPRWVLRGSVACLRRHRCPAGRLDPHATPRPQSGGFRSPAVAATAQLPKEPRSDDRLRRLSRPSGRGAGAGRHDSGPRRQGLPARRQGTLFRAMSARSDAEWLTATNAWAAAAALPEITLRPGPEPRFERLELAAAEPVLSRDKVSVIMPAFNARATIEQAARSILAQSWRNLELIIVDDCSTDGTAAAAERLAAEDARVRVLRNPANVGPYVSKNRALLVATGRYVTGHDADDIAIPTRIADQMQPIRDNTACVATIGSMIRLDRDGAFSYPTKVGSYSYDGISRRAMISLLIDRQVLLGQLGFWDSVRFGADSEMLARATAVLGSRLREVRKVLMLCLNVEGSLTNNACHGISAWDGVSPIRKAYRDAWAAWHAATPIARPAAAVPASRSVVRRARGHDRGSRVVAGSRQRGWCRAAPSGMNQRDAGQRMRVGIVSYWFNRGQAVVSRRIRAALDAAGLQTFVLARPTKDSFVRSRFIDRTGPWAQRGVTTASRFDIPEVEYLEWAADNVLDVVLCDQNLQFRELAALRQRGVRTVGRFVWEAFRPEDVAGARRLRHDLLGDPLRAAAVCRIRDREPARPLGTAAGTGGTAPASPRRP